MNSKDYSVLQGSTIRCLEFKSLEKARSYVEGYETAGKYIKVINEIEASNSFIITVVTKYQGEQKAIVPYLFGVET